MSTGGETLNRHLEHQSGRLLTRTNRESEVVTYAYEPDAGTLTSVSISGVGVVREYTYDALGRTLRADATTTLGWLDGVGAANEEGVAAGALDVLGGVVLGHQG